MARLAIRWYYRSVEVSGREHIQAQGPVILAANHNNALVDALLVATSVSREVRLTAKATLLDHPLTRVVVRAVGIIPLRRASDEARHPAGTADAQRNQGAFDLVVSTLTANGLVLIFPEGKSHSEPALAPLRSGCARIALQAVECGIPSLPIVPVGLTFEAKGRPRSRVLVQFGASVQVTPECASTPDAVMTLTDRITDALRAVTLNFESQEAAHRVLLLAEQLATTLDETRPLSTPVTPLAEVVAMARVLEVVRQRLPELTPDLLARTDETLRRLEQVQEEAAALRVPLGELTMETSARAGLWFVVRELLIAVACAPVAWWGRLNHWVPLQLALWFGRRTSRNPDEPAMHTLVAGLVIVLLTYALIAAAVVGLAGGLWAGLYLASLPPAASLHFWFTDRWRSVVQRARGYLALRRFPERARALVLDRHHLITDVRDLAQRLLATGTRQQGETAQPGPSATPPGAAQSADP